MKRDRQSVRVLIAMVVAITFLHAQKIRQRDAVQQGTSFHIPTFFPSNGAETSIKPVSSQNFITTENFKTNF